MEASPSVQCRPTLSSQFRNISVLDRQLRQNRASKQQQITESEVSAQVTDCMQQFMLHIF